jgi:hypothetical protein
MTETIVCVLLILIGTFGIRSYARKLLRRYNEKESKEKRNKIENGRRIL